MVRILIDPAESTHTQKGGYMRCHCSADTSPNSFSHSPAVLELTSAFARAIHPSIFLYLLIHPDTRDVFLPAPLICQFTLPSLALLYNPATRYVLSVSNLGQSRQCSEVKIRADSPISGALVACVALNGVSRSYCSSTVTV